ncbi:YolD-like family protein [Streptomyces avermitilis]
MILPEHRAAILRHAENAKKRTRPVLDEHEAENISRALAESKVRQVDVLITLFDPFEDREVRGVVTRYEQHTKRLRIEHGEEWDWIDMRDVVRAEVGE